MLAKLSGIVDIEDGMDIDFKDIQSWKIATLKFITEDGIFAFFNDLFPSKALLPIDVTVGGNSISSSEHLQKALFLITVKLEGFSNVTCFNKEHSENAFDPISVIDEGILTAKSCLVLYKKLSLILEIDEVNETAY